MEKGELLKATYELFRPPKDGEPMGGRKQNSGFGFFQRGGPVADGQGALSERDHGRLYGPKNLRN